MAKATYIMLDMGLMDYRILSIRNDGISVQPGKHLVAVRECMQKMIYGKLSKLSEQKAAPLRRFSVPPPPPIETPSSSETLAFRVEVKAPDMPGGLLAIRDAPVFELPEQSWNIQSESPTDDDFYQKAIHPHVIEGGKGALITGPAGTGKSTILKRLEADLEAQGHRVKKISVTNVACKRLGLDASTILLGLAAHRRVQHAFGSSTDVAGEPGQCAWCQVCGFW